MFIPENGDQVLVGFMNNSLNNPVVTGALFNGKTGTGGGADNHLKTIVTRNGCAIQFDDTDGKDSITIHCRLWNKFYPTLKYILNNLKATP